MSEYLVFSVVIIIIGVIGYTNPELGGRAWGSVQEIKDDPETVAKRSRTRNKTLSAIIILLGVVLLVFSLTQ